MGFASSGSQFFSGGGTWGNAGDINLEMVGHRLSLTSGTAVTTSDVTGASTVYWTPYISDRMALYTAGAWRMYTVPELSMANGTFSSSTNPYDLYVYDNAGTLTLTRTIAWTSATSGRVAQTTQDGVVVLSSDKSQRYVGTILPSDASNHVDDSGTKRFVWNMYNRVPRPMQVTYSAGNYTYTINTYRQAAGSTGQQLSMVRGFDFDAVLAINSNGVSSNQAGGVTVYVGIGLDSTTVNFCAGVADFVSTLGHNVTASGVCMPGLGSHYLARLEKSVATGVTTWNNDGNFIGGMVATVLA